MFVPKVGSFDWREVGISDVEGTPVPPGQGSQLGPVPPERVPSDRRDRQRRTRVEYVGPRPASQSAGGVQRLTYGPHKRNTSDNRLPQYRHVLRHRPHKAKSLIALHNMYDRQ